MQHQERVLLISGDLAALIAPAAALAAQRIGNALYLSALDVLTGSRSGRIYPYKGGTYQASAPGEPPAERSGALRHSWRTLPPSMTAESPNGFTLRAGIVSEGVPYLPHLQAIRPIATPILDAAESEITQILAEPWLPRSLA